MQLVVRLEIIIDFRGCTKGQGASQNNIQYKILTSYLIILHTTHTHTQKQDTCNNTKQHKLQNNHLRLDLQKPSLMAQELKSIS